MPTISWNVPKAKRNRYKWEVEDMGWWDDHGALAWRTHEDVAVRVPFNVRLGKVIYMGTALDGFYPARVSSGRERSGE